MKQNVILALVFAALLSACGADLPDQKKPAADTQAQAEKKPAPATKRPPTLKEKADTLSKLPDNAAAGQKMDAAVAELTRDGMAWLRYDRPGEQNGKVKRVERQVFVELLGADVSGAEAAVREAFESVGYTVDGRRDGGNGAVNLRLRSKEDKRDVHVLIRSKAGGPELKKPEATSSVYLRRVLE